jgi:GAF domain-containing protein
VQIMSDGVERFSDSSYDPASASIVARFESSAGDHVTDVAPDDQLLGDRLCRAVVEVLGVDGAAISVYLGDDVTVPVGASDLQATIGESLQATLREGPCFEAYSGGLPILLPDLQQAGTRAWTTWPTYADALVQNSPFRAVFAYPLLTGGSAFGSLSLYRRTDGPVDGPRGAADIAERVGERLLETNMIAGPAGDPEPPWLDSPTARRRRMVWLAQGLTLEANRITPGQAIDMLRAHAFSAGRLLDDVADDIVSGRIPVPTLTAD